MPLVTSITDQLLNNVFNKIHYSGHPITPAKRQREIQRATGSRKHETTDAAD